MPEKPTSVRPVDYKGEPLDAERGPGLGCFWSQLILLVAFIVLTPLTVAWNMPSWVSIVMLFGTIILLLFAGQTVIFLLRLVASDRRDGRRVPLAGASPTVGELEDSMPRAADAPVDGADLPSDAAVDGADLPADAPVDGADLPADASGRPDPAPDGVPEPMPDPAPDGVRE
jgi:hypothetical protein